MPKLNPALRELDAAGEEGKDYVVLSTGVELFVRQANPNILIRVMTAHKRPEPPMVLIDAIGKYVENSDDPDYIKRVKAWEMDYNSNMLNALVALGTSLKSKPKNVPAPESDEWLKDYRSLGLEAIPDSKAWRYTTWVMYVAAPVDQDIKTIGDAVRKLSGVREADVRDAETFPGSNQTDRAG